MSELPPNLSLLSPLYAPLTITSNEIIAKCEQRINNSESFTPFFDESFPPPEPAIIPFEDRPSINNLNVQTRIISVRSSAEAHSAHLRNLCYSYSSSILIIRGLPKALQLDLSLFTTKSMTKAQPNFQVEVRTQHFLPGDINLDEHGKPSWTCSSTRSYTTIEEYGEYQAESFLKNVKDEREGERLRSPGTPRTPATSRSRRTQPGTSLPISSLLSDSSAFSNAQESLLMPTAAASSSSSYLPPSKRRKTDNQLSIIPSSSPAAAANLDRSDPAQNPSVKSVMFGTNIDISDERKFRRQLKELKKLPEFIRNNAESCNLLAYIGYPVWGMNTVQMYMKVPGCRTPGHLENNCFSSVNINIGPGDCEWFGVDYAFWPVVSQMCNERGMNFLKDSWWPNFDDLIKARVPVHRFTQKVGDLVWVGGGCIHWVQSIGYCNNIAWNVGPMTAEQFELSLYSYEWNKLSRFQSLVPMQHLSWELAANHRFTNEPFFNVVKGVLIRSLAFCRMIYDYITSQTEMTINFQARIEEEAAQCCETCETEVFNLLFVQEMENELHVFCVHCAKETEFKDFSVLQQTSFEELSAIFDALQLHQAQTD